MNCNMNYQTTKQSNLNINNFYVVKCNFKQLQHIKTNTLTVKYNADSQEKTLMSGVLKKKLNL